MNSVTIAKIEAAIKPGSERPHRVRPDLWTEAGMRVYASDYVTATAVDGSPVVRMRGDDTWYQVEDYETHRDTICRVLAANSRRHFPKNLSQWVKLPPDVQHTTPIALPEVAPPTLTDASELAGEILESLESFRQQIADAGPKTAAEEMNPPPDMVGQLLDLMADLEHQIEILQWQVRHYIPAEACEAV